VRPASLITFLSVLACAGCGGGDSATSGAPGEASGGAVPAALVGTYTATLREADVPENPPPELGELTWTLRIGDKGGPDGGPFLAIDSPTLGNLEAPSLRVEGDRLLLRHEECAAGGTERFYDNEYRWELAGTELSISTITNQCDDHVAETILTSRPWTKTG
jgi:hypothetical protein